MAKIKKKDSRQIIFAICVILTVVTAGYFVISDVISTIKNIAAEIPKSDIVSRGSEAVEIFVEMGEYVSDNINIPDINPSAFTESSTQAITDKSTAVYSGFGKVVRVVDGDTYVLSIDGVETKVRLIGVDTPESVAPETYDKENTEEGVWVSDIVKEKIKEGDILNIEYDVGRTDNYGRTLAYLYFSDGARVQDWLLSNGYAQVMTIQPNSKYADHFAELEQAAMERKVGLWNGAFIE